MPRTSWRIDWISFEKWPVRWPAAIVRDVSVRAWMMSMTACASERSRRPLRKARFVNSPRSAGLAPAFHVSSSVLRSVMRPPWHCSSTTSSTVYECGASMTSASASSMTLPLRSRTLTMTTGSTWTARWLPAMTSGLPFFARNTLSAVFRACSPLMRMTPMPPSPCGVAIALIVSPCCILGLLSQSLSKTPSNTSKRACSQKEKALSQLSYLAVCLRETNQSYSFSRPRWLPSARRRRRGTMTT